MTKREKILERALEMAIKCIADSTDNACRRIPEACPCPSVKWVCESKECLKYLSVVLIRKATKEAK